MDKSCTDGEMVGCGWREYGGNSGNGGKVG